MPFLQQVYSSTRTAELDLVNWTPVQKQAFLEMQFRAQHQHYQAHFAGAEFQIVLCNHQPIGRFYVCRSSNEIRILDIALLPEQRRRGIGSLLLKSVLTEAKDTGKPVRIYVERFNPALSLYERLGFSKIGDTGVYFQMEWVSQQQQNQTANVAEQTH